LHEIRVKKLRKYIKKPAIQIAEGTSFRKEFISTIFWLGDPEVL